MKKGDHLGAIDSIENDYSNTVGGYKAWTSGYTTYLTKTAEKKIEAINERFDRLFPDEE